MVTCRRSQRVPAHGNCLAELAAGYIHATDLCGSCTDAFMAALDWVNGTPLAWHQNYRDRAGVTR